MLADKGDKIRSQCLRSELLEVKSGCNYSTHKLENRFCVDSALCTGGKQLSRISLYALAIAFI